MFADLSLLILRNNIHFQAAIKKKKNLNLNNSIEIKFDNQN